MKLKKNQSGMAHLAIIIVIVLIVVIGFVAYRVTKKKDTPAITTQSTSKVADTSTKASSSSSPDTTSATKYLTIKEWGVKFALTKATADAYYDTKTSSNLDSMSLRVHSLDTESDCTNTALSVAGIFRVQKDAVDDQTGKKYSDAGDGKTVGDYYYFIQSSQYMCTESIEPAVILQGARNSFNTAGPSIVKS